MPGQGPVVFGLKQESLPLVFDDFGNAADLGGNDSLPSAMASRRDVGKTSSREGRIKTSPSLRSRRT